MIITCLEPQKLSGTIKDFNDILSRFTFSNGPIQFSDVFSVLRNLAAFCTAVATVENKKQAFEFERSPLRLQLNFLRQSVLNILAQLPTDIQYTLFVDGIDIRPDYIAFDTFKKCVSGLCDAVWILNSSHLRSVRPQALRVVLLVRPDILSNAGLQNLNLNVDTFSSS